MQGSILDAHVVVLGHRLRGLCDNVMGGHQEDSSTAGVGAAATGSEQFAEREMVFAIRSGGGGPGGQGMQGQQPAPLSLRIRKQGTDPPTAKDSQASLSGTYLLIQASF